VIAVGASTPFGDLASFSNTGEETDILAPGGNIISADVTNGKIFNGYGFCSGTSQAAAHVTASVALMLALDASLTPEDLKNILVDTANPGGPWVAGEINLTTALEQIATDIGIDGDLQKPFVRVQNYHTDPYLRGSRTRLKLPWWLPADG
jgi:subtilisin family serine protease